MDRREKFWVTLVMIALGVLVVTSLARAGSSSLASGRSTPSQTPGICRTG